MPSPSSPAEPTVASERRTEDRAQITLRVDYKRMNTFFADYARNISKGGTFIRTERPLEVGTEFFFELALPGQTESLTLLGEVVWVVAAEAATESGPAGMGIRFKFEDESKRAELERFVRERMVDSLGAALAERLLSRKG